MGTVRGRGITPTLPAAHRGFSAKLRPVPCSSCPGASSRASSRLASLVGVFASSASAATATGSATGLSSWRSCDGKLQCATLTVPVDYSQPDGEQVNIAVARLRATQPDRRLGSLVFNFGGPGDAGTETLPGYAGQIPATIRARYDLVSFDPRGTGSSRPVECIDDATTDRLNAVDPTPNSVADLHAFYDGTNEPVDVVARCVARNGAWLAQLGSRNVARDLDRLRTSIGDDTLSFVGYSYGTVIGSVYAQMFPEHVGRMVLDSRLTCPPTRSRSCAETPRASSRRSTTS